MKILSIIKNKFTEIVKDESGQGTTEYILILVAIVAVAMMFGGEIKKFLTTKVESLGGKITGFQP